MDKPLKDWTLREVKTYCTGRDCYKDGELAQSLGKCKILDVTPSEWDLDEKPFTGQEMEDAILTVWYGLLMRNGAGEIVRTKEGTFPSIQPGQSYIFDEIIGGDQ